MMNYVLDRNADVRQVRLMSFFATTSQLQKGVLKIHLCERSTKKIPSAAVITKRHAQ